jgi:P4 family phage/plasmid primase-like protien
MSTSSPTRPTDAPTTALVEAALEYAGYGWRVVPLHWIRAPGVCSCNKGAKCPEKGRGKHPFGEEWQKLATSDEAVITRTWEQRPKGNVGILMGKASDLVDFETDDPEQEQLLLALFDGNEDLVGFLQRAAGYSMVGLLRDHVLLVLYGTGANGKSTFLGALQDVFGQDYSMKSAPDLLMAKRNEAHPTERADLFGKRLVVGIETEDGRRLSESIVKELTGGDRIRGRRMREDFWEFPPHAYLVAGREPQARDPRN